MDLLSGKPWESDIDGSVHTSLVSFDHQLMETDVDPPFRFIFPSFLRNLVRIPYTGGRIWLKQHTGIPGRRSSDGGAPHWIPGTKREHPCSAPSRRIFTVSVFSEFG